jgi:hypothetical protein
MFRGGRLGCVARLCSKSVRHFDQRDLPALDPLGHLMPVDPSVLVSNYYIERELCTLEKNDNAHALVPMNPKRMTHETGCYLSQFRSYAG